MRASSAVVFAIIVFSAASAFAEYPAVDSQPTLQKTGTNDVALIVAIEDYAFLPDVQGAVQTANAWESFFRGIGVPEIHVLVNSEAAKTDIIDFASRAATAVPENGTLWFVFVGHGAPTRDGNEGVIIGMDAKATVRSLEDRGVRQSQLVRQLEQGRQKSTVVVLDACFSGKSGSSQMLVSGMQPVVPTTAIQPAPRTTILSAAKADQFAGQLPNGGRPAFSYLLLGGLRGWADNGDGTVTADELVAYTDRNLRAVKTHRQSPQLVGIGTTPLAVGATESDPGLFQIISSGGPAANADTTEVASDTSAPARSNTSPTVTETASTERDGESLPGDSTLGVFAFGDWYPAVSGDMAVFTGLRVNFNIIPQFAGLVEFGYTAAGPEPGDGGDGLRVGLGAEGRAPISSVALPFVRLKAEPMFHGLASGPRAILAGSLSAGVYLGRVVDVHGMLGSSYHSGNEDTDAVVGTFAAGIGLGIGYLTPKR